MGGNLAIGIGLLFGAIRDNSGRNRKNEGSSGGGDSGGSSGNSDSGGDCGGDGGGSGD